MKLGDHVEWQAIRKRRNGMIIGISDGCLTIRDQNGVLWLIDKEDIISCH